MADPAARCREAAQRTWQVNISELPLVGRTNPELLKDYCCAISDIHECMYHFVGRIEESLAELEIDPVGLQLTDHLCRFLEPSVCSEWEMFFVDIAMAVVLLGVAFVIFSAFGFRQNLRNRRY